MSALPWVFPSPKQMTGREPSGNVYLLMSMDGDVFSASAGDGITSASANIHVNTRIRNRDFDTSANKIEPFRGVINAMGRVAKQGSFFWATGVPGCYRVALACTFFGAIFNFIPVLFPLFAPCKRATASGAVLLWNFWFFMGH